MAVAWKITRQRTSNTLSESPSADRTCISYGETDPTVIRDALTGAGSAGLPATLDGLPLKEIRQRSFQEDETQWTNTGVYGISERPETPATNDEQTSFKITGRQTRFLYSLQTVFSEGIAETGYDPPPDFKKGIGWDGTRFQGTELPPPQFTYTVTKYMPVATVTNAWVQARAEQAYTTNAAAFRGAAIGETLFVGLSGQQRNKDDFALTYDFQVRKTRTNLDVNGIVIPSIAGWDHLWQLWEPWDSNNRVAQRPIAAYVERLFNSSDFGQLGVSV